MVESPTPSSPQPSGEGGPAEEGTSTPSLGLPAPADQLTGTQAARYAPIEAPLDAPADPPIDLPTDPPADGLDVVTLNQDPAVEPPAQPVETPFATPPIPEVAATLHAPATEAGPEQGGEWALLVAMIQDWIGSGQLQDTFQRYLNPLKLLGVLLGVVVVLRLYGALLGAIESLPLVPGLLELAGLLWLASFSASNLVRSGDRRQLIETLEQRWRSFRGRA